MSKAIEDLPMGEYQEIERNIVKVIADSKRKELTIRDISRKLKLSMRYVHAFVEANDNFILNVAMSTGRGHYMLDLADQIVELSDEGNNQGC